MPRLSVFMLRAALLHLGIGFTFGALMLWNKGLMFDARMWLLLAPHLELVLLGWTMQLAMGTAFWILPRFSSAPRHGDVRWAWLAFACINIGVSSTALGTYLGVPWMILSGRLLELLAVASFAIHIWPRVKPLAFTPEVPRKES